MSTRPDIVAALIAGIGTPDADGYELLLTQATGAEVGAALARLRDAALAGARPVPDVLELNLWQTARLAAQGRALEWVGEQLGPIWSSRPDMTLADQLKIAEPWRVAQIRSALRRSGLSVDMGASGEMDDDGLDDEDESG
jgi:hypothetical protein